MKHRTADLEGALLDAAVAMAEGLTKPRIVDGWLIVYESPREGLGLIDVPQGWAFRPSTDWRCGGPIIDRERIGLMHHTYRATHEVQHTTDAFLPGRRHFSGPTPLIAAMRAYVASKFGEEIELP